MGRSSRLRLTVAATAAAMILTGCTSSDNSPTHPTATRRSSESSPSTPSNTSISTGTSQDRLGAAGCDPASPIAAGPEVQGTGNGATLYGLIMTSSPIPIRTGEPVKIVWRMTGSGPLQLSTTTPQGNAVALQWGPEPHGGSSYDRPGSEWGAGYLFTKTGCWHLHAQRTVGSADVWIHVQPK